MKVKNTICMKIMCAVLALVLAIGAATVGVGAVVIGNYGDASAKDEIPFYEFDISRCPHEKMREEWVVERYPDGDVPGAYVRYCETCGKPGESMEIPPLKVSTASLVINDSLAINFKISKALMAEGSYKDPYVMVTLRGETAMIGEYQEAGDYLVFNFDNIAPHMMNETITVQPYAICYGKMCKGKTMEYSVAKYCYNTLDAYADNAKLRTLLVDLLNYGAAAQVYTGNMTDRLVNANLTDAQKAWGTATDRQLTTVQDTKYVVRENATVKWKSAGLSLQDSVALRFKIDATSIEGLYARVVSQNGIHTIPSSRFVATEGGYYVYYDRLSAADMSDPVYVTIFDENGPISNTFSYSAESYAYSMKEKSNNQRLIDLINTMIRYGDSAKAYVTPDGEGTNPGENWVGPY